MKKAYITPIITLLTLCIIALPQTTAETNSTSSPQNMFLDHFQGDKVNRENWNVQENTHMSGLPAFGGSVKVANSQITLASTPDGTSFPYITSAHNPFPTEQDFTVEFDLTYTCISDWGTGVWISQKEFGNSDAKVVLQVWADNEASWTSTAIRVSLLGTPVYRSQVSGWEPSADTHTFRLKYQDNVYKLFIDQIEIATASSTIKPDTIGFGHPPSKNVPFTHERAIGNVGGWSSFKIDYIQIAPLAALSLKADPSNPQLSSEVKITGTLDSQDGTPLKSENVTLSYKIPTSEGWIPITTSVTNQDGSYTAGWLPTATGNFTIKAEWENNAEAFDNIHVTNGESVLFNQDSTNFGLISLLILLAVAVVGLPIYIKKRRVNN
jgi:hypothetical protein